MVPAKDYRFRMEFSDVKINDETVSALKDLFVKLLPHDSPGEFHENLDPLFMRAQFEKLGMDKDNPSIYNMICWMDNAYRNSIENGKGISFNEFLEQAVFFFSQRHHEEGLRYIY